jgi:hypothetical protein
MMYCTASIAAATSSKASGGTSSTATSTTGNSFAALHVFSYCDGTDVYHHHVSAITCHIILIACSAFSETALPLFKT